MITIKIFRKMITIVYGWHNAIQFISGLWEGPTSFYEKIYIKNIQDNKFHDVCVLTSFMAPTIDGVVAWRTSVIKRTR